MHSICFITYLPTYLGSICQCPIDELNLPPNMVCRHRRWLCVSRLLYKENKYLARSEYGPGNSFSLGRPPLLDVDRTMEERPAHEDKKTAMSSAARLAGDFLLIWLLIYGSRSRSSPYFHSIQKGGRERESQKEKRFWFSRLEENKWISISMCYRPFPIHFPACSPL